MSLFLFSSLVLVVAIVFVAVRVLLVFRQHKTYARYWGEGNKAVFDNNTLTIVMLGDSIIQGIGASAPKYGLAGLITGYVADETERPVRVLNYSRTGAKVRGVVEVQLPKVSFAEADLVIVVASANDTNRRTPIEEYTKDIERLVAALPAEKTIIADVPGLSGREKYQQHLEAAAKQAGLRRAKLIEAFARVSRSAHLTAGDFFHPNNKGYEFWLSAFKPELDALLPQLKSRAR